jgi:hypothetical protein
MYMELDLVFKLSLEILEFEKKKVLKPKVLVQKFEKLGLNPHLNLSKLRSKFFFKRKNQPTLI